MNTIDIVRLPKTELSSTQPNSKTILFALFLLSSKFKAQQGESIPTRFQKFQSFDLSKS